MGTRNWRYEQKGRIAQLFVPILFLHFLQEGTL